MEDAPAPEYGSLTIREFVDRLASAEPVPGGGSASAIAGSLAAALVAMVATLSRDRPKYAEHMVLHAQVEAEGRELAAHLMKLAGEDAQAYGALASALKQPRDTPETAAARAAALRSSARQAASVPLEVLEACVDVIAAAEALAGRSNRNASSDLNVAALLAAAAASGAAANVLANLPALDPTDPFVRDAEERVGILVEEADRLATRTRDIVASGEARPPVPAALDPEPA